ncbi:MOSC N-terminal beta barrel domain-containing protein [bacterium]|nr:MOSC N-terminal beta barrel domain-containing protein [bacterium]
MRVTEIWRSPVKSMGGETLLSAEVTEFGIAGDRGWSIYDHATGTTLTARRTPELLFASARFDADDLVIVLPDGSEFGADGSARLSAWLSRDVELRSTDEHNADTGGVYEVPLDAENDAKWVSWTGPGGAFHDSAKTRLSLVSTATLGNWDRRRFRTNVIVDAPGEDDFVGQRVSIGDLTLNVTKQVDRCVMVSRPQPGLDRDLQVLKTITAERATFLAVGCVIAEPGVIALGDEVRVQQ